MHKSKKGFQLAINETTMMVLILLTVAVIAVIIGYLLRKASGRGLAGIFGS